LSSRDSLQLLHSSSSIANSYQRNRTMKTAAAAILSTTLALGAANGVNAGIHR